MTTSASAGMLLFYVLSNQSEWLSGLGVVVWLHTNNSDCLVFVLSLFCTHTHSDDSSIALSVSSF